MRLDQILERIQSHDTRIVKQEPNDGNEVEQDSSTNVISEEIVNNGLMAVGGCRRCSKTFTDRLQLIHHFVDHFPSIFYSFESINQVESNFFTQLAEILSVDKETQKVGLKNEANVIKTVKSNKAIASSDKIMNVNSTKLDTYHMCPHCCLTFGDSQSFEAHLKTHTENTLSSQNFKCDQCEFNCKNLYLLEDHRQKLHKKSCYVCGEQFETTFDLNLHVGETHLGNPYSCKDCGLCFETRKSLAEHNKTHRIIANDSNESDKEAIFKNEFLDEIEKPKSLLSSNLYFNGLVKNISRRRRTRNLKLNRAKHSKLINK